MIKGMGPGKKPVLPPPDTLIAFHGQDAVQIPSGAAGPKAALALPVVEEDGPVPSRRQGLQAKGPENVKSPCDHSIAGGR